MSPPESQARWVEPETAKATAGPRGPLGTTGWEVASCGQVKPGFLLSRPLKGCLLY